MADTGIFIMKSGKPVVLHVVAKLLLAIGTLGSWRWVGQEHGKEACSLTIVWHIVTD